MNHNPRHSLNLFLGAILLLLVLVSAAPVSLADTIRKNFIIFSNGDILETPSYATTDRLSPQQHPSVSVLSSRTGVSFGEVVATYEDISCQSYGHVEFGTSPNALTQRTPPEIILAASGAQPFVISGLTPGTQYFARVVISLCDTTLTSNTALFQTRPLPFASQFTSQPSTLSNNSAKAPVELPLGELSGNYENPFDLSLSINPLEGNTYELKTAVVSHDVSSLPESLSLEVILSSDIDFLESSDGRYDKRNHSVVSTLNSFTREPYTLFVAVEPSGRKVSSIDAVVIASYLDPESDEIVTLTDEASFELVAMQNNIEDGIDAVAGVPSTTSSKRSWGWLWLLLVVAFLGVVAWYFFKNDDDDEPRIPLSSSGRSTLLS